MFCDPPPRGSFQQIDTEPLPALKQALTWPNDRFQDNRLQLAQADSKQYCL